MDPVDMESVAGIDQLCEGLYLSSIHGLRRNRAFIDKHIDVLFCVARELEPELRAWATDSSKEVLFLPLDDSPEQALDVPGYARCLDQLVRRQGRNVLVFCQMGISRSASVCIAYFIKYRSMTFTQSVQHVKRKRSIIYPNTGFVQQLKASEIC